MLIMNKETVRLDKFLANAGIVSRRGVKRLLQSKKVRVNNETVLDAGLRIVSDKDRVAVDGKVLDLQSEYVYIVLNKPKGVVSTVKDEFDRPTVVSLVEDNHRLYPVGRLDEDSIGLVLLTNDGELTHKITHPKKHTSKTYQVLVQGEIAEEQLDKLRNGVELKDGKTAPAEVKVLKQFKKTTLLEIVLYEGRNRQIRRMCAAVEMELWELKIEILTATIYVTYSNTDAQK